MRDPVNPPSTEAEPQTAQGRNLLDDLPDYVDGTVPYVRRDLRRRILAIETEARAEGRQEAVREATEQIVQQTYIDRREDGLLDYDRVMNILDRVAGLDASEQECGCRHWIRHVVADLWEETPERQVCPECHHDYHPNGPCGAGLNASESPPTDDVGRLGLSAEQDRNLRQHLIARQQTLGEWIGDVLFEYRMGRPDGIDYPPAQTARGASESGQPPEATSNE